VCFLEQDASSHFFLTEFGAAVVGVRALQKRRLAACVSFCNTF
jgi:hypothetical protein